MEIELYSKIQNPIETCERVGKWLVKSGVVKSDREETGQVAMVIAMSEGKSIVDVVRTYDFMATGGFRKKAQAGLAEFRRIGGKHKWLTDPMNQEEAAIELTLEGSTLISKFTIEHAKKRGYVRPKSAWETTPESMLRARAISNGVIMLAPEIYAGDSIEDEQEPVSPKPLLCESAPVVNAEPEKKPEVSQSAANSPIDIASTVAQSEAQPESRRYTISDIANSPETGRLTVDAMGALESVIGEANMPKLIAWLQNRKWITEGLSTLSVDRAKRLFEKPADVINTIGAS